MEIRLVRLLSTEDAVLGALYVGETRQCWMLELPWKNNEHNESCIPAGEYDLVPTHYNRGGYDSFEVAGVPGRDLIKWHGANRPDQIDGCQAPGRDMQTKPPRVWSSRKALSSLLTLLNRKGGESHRLVIEDGPGVYTKLDIPESR